MKNHVILKNHETLETLVKTMKKVRDPMQKVRLRAIILRKRGENPQEIAERLLVTDRAVRQWILLYNAGGRDALIPKSPGRPKGTIKWDRTVFDALVKEIDKTGGYWTIPRMQTWLLTHHQLAIPEQTVWYRVSKLGYSYKSARPHPSQGDGKAQDAFKKRGSKKSWRRYAERPMNSTSVTR